MKHGVVSTEQLRAMGVSRDQVRTLVAHGRLSRVRRGWYARPGAHPWVQRAVDLGGRVGCVSGCQLHGVFTPPHSELHVVYGQGLPVVADAAGVLYHPLGAPQPRQPLCSLVECLSHVLHRHDPETGLVCLESAVNSKMIRESLARRLIVDAPSEAQSTLALFSSQAQSGSETRVRVFLQSRRVRVTPQYQVPGLGLVDLLVGESLLLECDSETYHAGDLARDHRRDMMAHRLGYAVIRLSWSQVWLSWPETQDYLLDVIRTRRHRLPLRPLAR